MKKEANMTATILTLPANSPNAWQNGMTDWDGRAKFASLAQAAFAGVSVLPNAEVLRAAIDATGRSWRFGVTILAEDTDDSTTYVVSRVAATYTAITATIKIDAYTGKLIVVDEAE